MSYSPEFVELTRTAMRATKDCPYEDRGRRAIKSIGPKKILYAGIYDEGGIQRSIELSGERIGFIALGHLNIADDTNDLAFRMHYLSTDGSVYARRLTDAGKGEWRKLGGDGLLALLEEVSPE